MLLALGLLAILVVALGREGSIGTLVVAIAIAAAGYVCWAIPLGRIDRLGRELQHELAGAGIATDRRAPLHNQRLYRAWLARNRLTDDTVLRVVGVPEV